MPVTELAGIHALIGAMRASWTVVFLVFVACTASSSSSAGAGGSSPSCSAFGGSDLVDGSAMCTMKYAECTDGLTYTVSCPGSDAPCSCEVDGGAAGQFEAQVCGLSGAQLMSAVDQGCGWTLR